MKIRIAYTDEEHDKKEAVKNAVQNLFPTTKVKETPNKDGFLHTFLTVSKPENQTK